MINLTFEVLGQASFVLKEMFIFLSAYVFLLHMLRGEQFLLRERSVGL